MSLEDTKVSGNGRQKATCCDVGATVLSSVTGRGCCSAAPAANKLGSRPLLDPTARQNARQSASVIVMTYLKICDMLDIEIMICLSRHKQHLVDVKPRQHTESHSLK